MGTDLRSGECFYDHPRLVKVRDLILIRNLLKCRYHHGGFPWKTKNLETKVIVICRHSDSNRRRVDLSIEKPFSPLSSHAFTCDVPSQPTYVPWVRRLFWLRPAKTPRWPIRVQRKGSGIYNAQQNPPNTSTMPLVVSDDYYFHASISQMRQANY